MSLERLSKMKPNYARVMMFNEKKPVPFFVKREIKLDNDSLMEWENSKHIDNFSPYYGTV